MVKVLGDLSGLSKSVTNAGSKAAGAADKIHGAFSSVLGTLNRTGVLGGFGEALTGVDEALSTISEHGKEIGQVMLGVGGTLVGVGLGLQAIGSKDKAAHQQLQAAVEATGRSYDDYEKQIESTIKAQEKFGHTADQTQDALRILTTATNDPAKALKLMGEASDLAAAKHENLSQAATDLGKVYNGNTKLLKEFGIVVQKQPNYLKAVQTATSQSEKANKNLATAQQHLADIEALDAGKKKLTTAEAIRLRDAQLKVRDATAVAVAAHQKLAAAQDAAKASAGKQTDAVDTLGKKLSGQASAAADTFMGKLDGMKARFEDSAAQLGQKYGPAITAAGAALTGLGAAIEVARSAQAAFTAIQAASIPVELAMLAPVLLIIAALAALGVAAYLIYRNWNTIWNGMKVAVQAVWTWIKANWPLLLGVLLGPFALAAAAIYKYHDQILAALKAIWAWITTTWATLTGYIEAPFKAASTWIVGAMNTLIGFIAGLPARITQISAGMFHGMWEAFRSMVNGIIDLWNQLHFTLPKINEGPIHIGGETIGVPRIPHLAQGGLITQSGIAMVHQGETVTPAGKRTGPAVVLQNAVFNSGVDIDLFMRKAAWVAQTARI